MTYGLVSPGHGMQRNVAVLNQYVNIIHHGFCVGINLEDKKWKKTLKINKKRPMSKQKATSRQ